MTEVHPQQPTAFDWPLAFSAEELLRKWISSIFCNIIPGLDSSRSGSGKKRGPTYLNGSIT